MDTQQFKERLIAHIGREYGLSEESAEASVPPQGMSSSVFFVTLSDGTECAVKYGSHAMKDAPALELIANANIGLPIPTLVASFMFEDMPVVILKKIDFPLLDTVAVSDMHLYVPSMVETLNKLHRITSTTAGPLGNMDNKTWEDILLSIFDGTDFDWQEVANREGLERDLILRSVEAIKKRIESMPLNLSNYSLLHTDFNQRNLFVNPADQTIAAIIDWEEAMFGDPIYDFARVRMYLWHFNQSDAVIDRYYKLVNFTPEQKDLEELYWLTRVIQYLAWYSEDLNEFSRGRIKLHQDYLRAYEW